MLDAMAIGQCFRLRTCINDDDDGFVKQDECRIDCFSRSHLFLKFVSVTAEKVTSLFEKTLPDSPLKLAWDGKYICAALATQYVMITIGNL